MPTVLLRKDDAENVSQTYVVGEHILGRGKSLQCTSKKVSRNHGVLNVTANGVFLKSTHNNPCFYKPELSEKISMLTFGNTIKISHNDKIALALDHGWFIVLVTDNDNNTDGNQANASSANNEMKDANEEDSNETFITEILKRAIENADKEEENPAKKLKPDEILPVVIKSEPLDDAPSTSSSNNNSTNITVKQEPVEELPTAIDLSTAQIKIEPVSNTEDNTNNVECKKEDETDDCKKEKEDETKECKNEEQDDDKPSTSGTDKRPWRDRCWYGSACYRKNGQHRVEFKHPGDADYDSDGDDTRPVCCYGADCYRKNREHRKRYRHPGQTKLGGKPPPPPPKRRVRPPPNQLSQDSEELDDYDYSDPFIDDGSEDEYEPSQNTDTESEYEDSQEADEDHKRLLIEARKFTRNQK